MTTDIIMTTCNRPDYLVQAMTALLDRTKSPYRLHVIDDGSGSTNRVILRTLFQKGDLASLTFRRDQVGARANLNLGLHLSFSDPVVFVDDDIICPDLNPDWLARGLQAMEEHDDLAMLALRHPGAKVKVYKKDDGLIAYCKSIGGTYCFISRSFLELFPLPHEPGDLEDPMRWRCETAEKYGFKVGVMQEVFCQHIGRISALTGDEYKGAFIDVIDDKTLEPVKRRW